MLAAVSYRGFARSLITFVSVLAGRTTLIQHFFSHSPSCLNTLFRRLIIKSLIYAERVKKSPDPLLDFLRRPMLQLVSLECNLRLFLGTINRPSGSYE